jgi:excisionase family DNA binding protein
MNSPAVRDFLNIDVLAEAVASRIKMEVASKKRVFDLDEAAAYCGLTRDSFKKKVVRDKLRKVKLDRCWRFDKADLDEWIEKHKEQIAAENAA